MKDPRPWSDQGGDATALERELVRAGRGVRPSRAQKMALWGAIAARSVPVAMGKGAAAAAGKAASGAALAVLKGAAVALLLAAGAVTALTSYRLMFRAAPAPAAGSGPAPAVTAVTAAVQTEVSPAELGPPSGPAAEGPLPAKPAHPSSRPGAGAREESATSLASGARASRLREETATILEARGALRGGEPARALTLLARARDRFPDGILLQEREALTIEALAASGARALAAQRARSFLRNHPESPHAADVASFLAGP